MRKTVRILLVTIVVLVAIPVILFVGREVLHWCHYRQIEKEGKLRAKITVIEAPKILASHENGRCKIEVKNLGTTTWTAREHFRLGGFERDWKLNRVEPARVRNPGRIEVSRDVKQNEVWAVSFEVEAPEMVRKYELYLQMLRERGLTTGPEQDRDTWFGEEQAILIRVR